MEKGGVHIKDSNNNTSIHAYEMTRALPTHIYMNMKEQGLSYLLVGIQFDPSSEQHLILSLK